VCVLGWRWARGSHVCAGCQPAQVTRVCPCPSPDTRYGHATVAPSSPSRRRLRLTVAGRGPASSILPFARSMLTSLRHPWLRPPIRLWRIGARATPAPGHGQPLAALCSTGWQPVCLHGSPSARCIITRTRFENGEQPDRGHAQKSGDMCGRRVPIFGRSSELVHAAGFEHVTGRLRWGDDTRGSHVTRLNDRPAP
jgi:hypothetical protein